MLVGREVWKNKVFLCLENRQRKTCWKMSQAQQEVNIILSRGTAGIDGHGQHIPTTGQTRPDYRDLEEIIWAVWCNGDWFTFWLGSCRWSKHYSSFSGNVQACKHICGSMFMWVLQYLHEAAALSFGADKKACGDTGDLTKQERHKHEEKQREGQGAGRGEWVIYQANECCRLLHCH